ncbi:MAG: hypothetical protein AAGD09_06975, partial [Cyanobacteria bacterium P01_F01_bin.56]
VPEAYFGMMQATYFIGGGLKASLFFCLSIFSKLCPAYFRLALSPAKASNSRDECQIALRGDIFILQSSGATFTSSEIVFTRLCQTK